MNTVLTIECCLPDLNEECISLHLIYNPLFEKGYLPLQTLNNFPNELWRKYKKRPLLINSGLSKFYNNLKFFTPKKLF